MLRLSNLSKSFKNKIILDNVNFELHKNDICGIIGANGAGKTTLLKIITQEIQPDEGKVTFDPLQQKIVYHTQFIDINEKDNLTIEEYILDFYPGLNTLYEDIKNLSNKNDEISVQKSIELQNIFSEKNGYEILGNIPIFLSKIGLAELKPETEIKNLSGGQKTRLQFIKLVMESSDILLLDEPTNHLDEKGILWLENYIKNRNGITMIVSHDRYFLNKIVNKIFELDNGKGVIYGGNYDDYKEQKKNKLERDRELYEAKMKDVRRLEAEANRRLSEVKVTDKKFIRGWEGPVIRKVAGKKAKTAQLIKRKVEENIKEHMPEKPMVKDTIKFELQQISPSGQLVCKIENLSFGYEPGIDVLKNVNLEIWRGNRVAVVGENGSGKSSLLRLITFETQITRIFKGANYTNEQLSPLLSKEGTKGWLSSSSLSDNITDSTDSKLNHPGLKATPPSKGGGSETDPNSKLTFSGSIKLGENVKIGYFSQEHEMLDQENTVLDEFRKYVEMTEGDTRTFLYYMLFSGNQVFQKIHTLSQGEKSKLMLAILLSQGANFLVLDEPTNHLDIPSREVLEEALKKYDGTILVVSHDKYFLEKIGVQKIVNL
jgi:ATPase subunit of ABC transporter with duplicated ATPase domains